MGLGKDPGRDNLRTLTFEEALDAYENARHRLPPMPERAGEAESVPNLDALADRFDVFLLDGFGVLNVGDSPIPGAAERVGALRAAGKTVLVLTNAASQPPSGLSSKYARLGFRFAPDDIVSSRSVLMTTIGAREERRWGVMLPEGAPLDDLPQGHHAVPLADDPAAYCEADGFLLLGSGGWCEARQAMLEAALSERPRAVLVGNPDIVAPREEGLTLEPGWYAHRLADRMRIAPVFCGKPFGPIFEAARARLCARHRAGRALMVGDSLHTDILGARAAGIASALVCGFGFFAGRPCRQALVATDIVPDFVIERP